MLGHIRRLSEKVDTKKHVLNTVSKSCVDYLQTVVCYWLLIEILLRNIIYCRLLILGHL